MSPVNLILILSVTFGALTTIFMVISLSPITWETTQFDQEQLKKVEGIYLNESYFDDTEGFYKVVVSPKEQGHSNKTTYLLRNTYGGLWTICDTISDVFRNSPMFQQTYEVSKKNHITAEVLLTKQCFHYVTEYNTVKDKIDDIPGYLHSASLFKMHNSAASCGIVAILCLCAAVFTGSISIWQKQVSACMVTGVMYIVAGVFLMFTLIIMLTKLGYQKQNEDCYSLDVIVTELCECRTEEGGWSQPIGWVGFSLSLIAMGFWLYLARCFRLETAKSML